MLNGVESPYGRPLFAGDPDGVLNVLGAITSPSLSQRERDLIATYMFSPGGIPAQFENLFP